MRQDDLDHLDEVSRFFLVGLADEILILELEHLFGACIDHPWRMLHR
jgi:hypothetical protein